MNRTSGNRLLDWVERVGNRMPDPAMHFLIALSLVWILSAALTPLSPYFPLVVAFCARCVRGTGIGAIISLLLPFAAVCMAAYLFALSVFWLTGLPFGIQAPFLYP